MTKRHAKMHWYRVEAIDARRQTLCDYAIDRSERRELWHGLRNLPDTFVARYNRLSKATSRYRVAYTLGV